MKNPLIRHRDKFIFPGNENEDEMYTKRVNTLAADFDISLGSKFGDAKIEITIPTRDLNDAPSKPGSPKSDPSCCLIRPELISNVIEDFILLFENRLSISDLN